MNYGFVIDNRKCIGCHACSTACKSENEVPLGVHRTWVKYVERGVYPDVRRSFQVTRCNHCENPPCVRICPVTAMYQRTDGIVEFDKDACIGCKACMQACPYDAIYIDPESHTAAKCHYCSHRVEVGLEPACAVVCPTHAIVAGDLDDPMSEIARLVQSAKTTVRKPEQGTAPKVLYIEGDDVALHPTVFAEGPRQGMMFSDVVTEQGTGAAAERGRAPLPTAAPNAPASTAPSGAAIRTPATQGVPRSGPIRTGGRPTRGMAEHMVQLAWNAQHQVPWHWPVPAYLVTKGIGTGIFLVLALGWGLHLFRFDSGTMLGGGLMALLFTLVTTALLVYDLERPERFLSILLRPQWKSWLTRGAFLLIGFTTVAGLWWTLEAASSVGMGPFRMPELLRQLMLWTTVPLALGAAVYTAFLFAQAEGRDLWQSPLLPFHLLVQALAMGAGSLLLLHAVGELPGDLVAVVRPLFGAMLVVDLFVTLAGELGIPHASEIAARAAHEIGHGRYAKRFWWGSVVVGHVLPLALLLSGSAALGGVGALLAGIGLYYYEHAFVMAPQEIPNS
ncbi:4Fe-4S dicluster domain-containing protein [Paraliomyxa miuraensis]|uniref:4Fe-4S dicluster domain-containing protein n=1 Tax=Paraliomyxa miuraensis TaxID=376150 RepID=UPI00225511A0|nr:4Fe-4S dicluster domain-containing protein [Paraliomyxa miuraensis]MCX4247495.1 polysulfide reductase NrfD [Paraliomyxa miuraensis]